MCDGEHRVDVAACQGPVAERVLPGALLVGEAPRVALGQNDVSIFERTLAWDHAAGALFLNEAGGKVARGDGSAYRVDEPDRKGLIAAATPALWDELAARLARLPSA